MRFAMYGAVDLRSYIVTLMVMAAMFAGRTIRQIRDVEGIDTFYTDDGEFGLVEANTDDLSYLLIREDGSLGVLVTD